MSNDNYLFHDYDLSSVLRTHQQKMVDEVNGMEPDYLLNASIEAVFTYIEDKYRINVPKLQEDGITADVSDSWQDGRDRYTGQE